MVKRTKKKKPDIEEDVLVPPRRRRYTRRADIERNNPVVQELLSRQTRYNLRSNENEELVTRAYRYTRKLKRPSSRNNNGNNNDNDNDNDNNNNNVNDNVIDNNNVNDNVNDNNNNVNDNENHNVNNNGDDGDDGDDTDTDDDDDDDDDDDGNENENGNENDARGIPREEYISSKLLKKKMSVINNKSSGIESYYCVLSQLLSGNVSMKDEIKEQVRIFSLELSNKSEIEMLQLPEGERGIIELLKERIIDDFSIIFYVTSLLYKFEIVVFQYVGNRKYRYHTTNTTVLFDRVLCMKFKNDKYEGLKIIRNVKKKEHNIEEFKIREILSHKNLMQLSNGAEFNIKWENYSDEHNSMEPWDELKDTEALEKYVTGLSSRVHGAKRAKDALAGNNVVDLPPYGVDVYDPNYNRLRYGPRKRWSFGLKKKFTGRKMTVSEDILKLKGRGGCYCFMPYENLDDNDKALFKIGMTLDFKSRLDEYHTYFPEGLYHVAFLIDPKVEEWSIEKKEEWRINANLKNFSKNDIMKAMKTQKYKEIEKFLFDHVGKNDGRRLYATVNVRNPDPITRKGATEWFYTDIGLIHEAFTNAEKRYGGEKILYHFTGLDPDTGENVESLNELAEKRKKMFPNYSGNILFNV